MYCYLSTKYDIDLSNKFFLIEKLPKTNSAVFGVKTINANINLFSAKRCCPMISTERQIHHLKSLEGDKFTLNMNSEMLGYGSRDILMKLLIMRFVVFTIIMLYTNELNAINYCFLHWSKQKPHHQ